MRSTERKGCSRAFATAAALVAALLSAGCADAPPNVLVVCIDALRADRLGTYGATPSPSPALDRLAARSVVFEDAASVASWTKPSVPSLLTGLYPAGHGVYDNSGRHVDTLGADTPTLAGILGSHGWRTAAFVENDQLLQRLSGLDRGFELYRDGAGTASMVFERFLGWISTDDARPWFAYLHVLDAHLPYAPADFPLPAEESARLRLRVAHWDLRGDYWWLLRRRVNEGAMRLDARALADLDALYRLEIRAVDEALGRMLAVLDREGRLDDTMVVLTSDHGEGFLERGRIDHGYGPYAELLRVPLVLHLPGGERGGTRSRALVQSFDLAATILDLVGIEKPVSWDSVSLLPAARTGREVREHGFAEEKHGSWDMVAVWDRAFRYVRSTDATEPGIAAAKPPPGAAPGARVRVRGILDEARFVAGSVRLLAPGDTDIELAGPVESIDGSRRSARILGIEVHVGDIGDGDPEDLRFEDLAPGLSVRAHGSMTDGALVADRVEHHHDGHVEIEGVMGALRVPGPGESRDAEVDLGGVRASVDPRAEWRDFPGRPAPEPELATGAPRTTEELFDRVADPHDLRDVGEEHPAELVRLRRLADSVRASIAAPATVGRVEIDEGARERLRAMGYLE